MPEGSAPVSNEQRGLVYDITPVLIWFMVIAAANALDDQPVRSIFPYLVPVLFVAWRHGIAWGFGFASVAAVTSAIGSTGPGVQIMGYLWPLITTYMKMSGAVIGICIGKYLAVRPDSGY